MSIMRRFISALVIATFFATGSAALAQNTGAKEETKKAGEATKEAGKDTAGAAKHAGKAAAKGTKKAGAAVKHAVTGDDFKATCKDGTTYTGGSREDACEKHGGVKVWLKTKN
jgi:Ni/Co efflux regulator RcnB